MLNQKQCFLRSYQPILFFCVSVCVCVRLFMWLCVVGMGLSYRWERWAAKEWHTHKPEKRVWRTLKTQRSAAVIEGQLQGTASRLEEERTAAERGIRRLCSGFRTGRATACLLLGVACFHHQTI